MEKFNLDSFIDMADVFLSNNDSCEYEVSQKAKKLYKNYPCYKEGIEQYKLTADILTSIRTPINKNQKEEKIRDIKVTGMMIKNALEDNRNIIQSHSVKLCIDKDILPYAKAFAIVYYWCGNMMPVINNPLMGNAGDDWHAKLQFIVNCFETKGTIVAVENDKLKNTYYRKSWPIWLFGWCEYKDDALNKFIEDNFLDDFFKKHNNRYILREKRSYQSKEWFLENTKFIIQRSFRICYAEEDFEKNEDNIRLVFKLVFEKAGIPDYENELDIIK